MSDLSITPQGTIIGRSVIGGTAGRVLFTDISGNLADDSGFNFDATNNAVAIGQAVETINVNSVSVVPVLTTDMESDLIGLMNHTHSSTAAVAANLILARSRGTHASPTIVATSDTLGILAGYGYSGNSGVGYQKAAQIRFEIPSSGTISTTSMPGQISFYTTPNTTVTPALALTIGQDKFATFQDGGAFSGQLAIGQTTAATAQLDTIVGSASRLGHIIKAASSQTANLTEWQNSSAVSMFEIDSSGQVVYAPENVTITAPEYFKSTSTITGNGAVPFIFRSVQTFEQTGTPPFGYPATFFTFQMTITYKTNNSTSAQPSAFFATPTYKADGVVYTGIDVATLATFKDGSSYSIANAGSFTGVYHKSFCASLTVNTGAAVDVRQAFSVYDCTGAGTLTTQYGIFIRDLAKATTNIPVYVLGTSGKSRHQPQIKFGADAAPSVDVDINGAWATAKSTVSLTADNQTVTTSNISYISLSSNNTTATNRTFILQQSTVAGHRLTIEWTGTNAGELIDDSAQGTGGNHRMAGNWTPTQYDTISFISNGTDWIETGRSTN